MRPDEELVSLLFPNEELYGLSLGILTIQICFQLVTMLPLMFLSGQNIMGTPDLATRYGYCKVKFDLYFQVWKLHGWQLTLASLGGGWSHREFLAAFYSFPYLRRFPGHL